MTSLVVDSWAWIEYLSGSEMGKVAAKAMSEASELWTSVASVAEIVSKYRRAGVDETQAMRAVASLSKIGVPDLDDAREAGTVHAELKPKSRNLSFADSFVLQLARKKGAKVLTGDPDFRGLKEAQLLE
jgi:predicted nucleic acid-binding protein